MNFTLSPETEALRAKLRDFVEREIMPLESDPAAYDDHENIALDRLEGLRAKAKQAGLWALQMPKARGGQGLKVAEMAPCYEEMGRSIFGPVVFNCAAPDDGNMILLEKVATEAQKTRWLQPIVDGKLRSAFAMTEPAAHFVVVARTSVDARKGLTAFLVHRDTPGLEIVRRIPIMGPEEHGGHCEMRFNSMRVPDSDRLMNVGDGLKVTQIRLGTARLTHCMRWLGMARRALEIARPWVKERQSFGMSLAQHEGVQWLLGEAAMAIEVGRLLTMRAAVKLDGGDFARTEISMAKIQVADTLHKSIDTAIQLLGAKGYSKDTPLEWMYRYARQARLVDGASEVHKMVLARAFLERGTDFWGWD